MKRLYELSKPFRDFIETGSEYTVIDDYGEIFRILLGLFEKLDVNVPFKVETQLWLFNLINAICCKKEQELSESSDISKEAIVDRVLDYISVHYLLNVKIKDIADYVHVSEGYLQKIFKKIIGIPIVEYINRKKIDLAKILLINTDMPIIDIVSEIGVGTQQYLNSLFKKYTGFTPKKYREFYYNNRGAEYDNYRHTLPNLDEKLRNKLLDDKNRKNQPL